MKFDPIVTAFDARKDFRAGLFQVFKHTVFDQFGFEVRKETPGLGLPAEFIY